MSMNLSDFTKIKRRQLHALANSQPIGTSTSYQARSGVTLCFGQTVELFRRILLMHLFRGPTCIFSLLLSLLLIVGSAFWPAVGLSVISHREASLIEEQKIESSFPIKLNSWLIGFEGDPEDTPVVDAAHRLMLHLSKLQNGTNTAQHWCGEFTDCSAFVHHAINPTQTSVLHPTNSYYIFLVRRVFSDVLGYHCYVPYKTFHSPETAITVFLPFKRLVDQFFITEHAKMNNPESLPELEIHVAALRRDIYAESPQRWSMEKIGKLFIITVMSAHQYLATACLVICFASIMSLDKENGFRPLMALMGMRRVSYLAAHLIIYQVGVVFLAAFGTLIHYTLGSELTDEKLVASDYFSMFISNVLASWHQFGLGLIFCSFARSTRTVMFPLLALFATLVIGQLVLVNQVLDDVVWQRNSTIDDMGYLIPSYAHSSLHIQILNKVMATRNEEYVSFYLQMQVVIALIFNLVGIYLDCVLNTGTGHKFNWTFPIDFCKVCLTTMTTMEEVDRQPSIFLKGNTNLSIDRLVEESKLQFTRVWLKGVTKDYIRWRGLRKSTFRAVTKVDLLLQKGEITAILGHNGAGKTTIFSILAGLQPATGGQISIFGKNPLDAWDAINLRKITGVCTQFDVLDDRLTAYEHMRLVGAIKGLSYSATLTETMKLFAQLELESYSDMATSLLPGGDKRKLSVAMALIGSPRLIMLDEPTSGVDPFSRRCIWRVLRDYRPNRVIVLITHYMDEADVLADRKAIMIGGRLVCYGTSKFLKENYNPGYMLHLTVMSKCKSAPRLKHFLCNRFTGVSFVREFNEQLTFFVQPHAITQLTSVLFSTVGQEELKACCVTSFGFTVTSLEEIFLKLDAEPMDWDDSNLLPVPNDIQSDRRKSRTVERIKQLTHPLSIRSWQERRSVSAAIAKEPLLPSSSRPSWRVGLRQFGVLLRVLLGLLILPTPIYILLRTCLPVIVVAISAIIYHLEITTMPNDIRLDRRWYVTRMNMTNTRQHLSFVHHKDSRASSPTTIDNDLFQEDINCLRTIFGPKEPYIEEFNFDPTTSPTGLSEDSTDTTHNYSRRGSTRYDIKSWNTRIINFTIILGQKDDDLTKQIVLHHFALWNCMHFRNLKMSDTLSFDEATVPWIGDVTSWESQWPEWHPQLKMGTACIYLIACGVASCILSPLIAADIVREKELRILTQLHLYGMKHWAYWGAHFFTHIFQYIMLACFTTIVMFPFKSHILSSWQTVILHNWINMLSAVDNILFIYVCCLFFQSAGGATVLFGSTVMIVIFVNITIFFIPLTILEAAYGFILFFFFFSDPFLSLLLTDFRIRLEKVYLFATTDAIYMPSLWRLLRYNHVKISQLIHSFRILVMGAVFIGANIYIHEITPRQKERKYYKVLRRLQPLSELDVRQMPYVVQATTEKVTDFIRSKPDAKALHNADSVVAFVYKLTKCYFLGSLSFLGRFLNALGCHTRVLDENTKVAVADISFLVKRSEIFGILGPSGSGKSTLLDCLATVLQQDSGQAGVVNTRTNELLPNPTAVEQGAIGFCPQYNPIWPQLTVREHLVIYSVMRDLNQPAIEAHVSKLISAVNMERYRDTYAGSLSGGCKRRLSMAISLVGDPSLVIMDEPSCGVDPRSRRNLWKTLLNCIRGTKRGCLVTTHFIDEGESLCDRLAIIVNGHMLSIGTPLALKLSCGRGLIIDLKMSRNYSLMPEDADYEVHHNLVLFMRYLKEQLPSVEIADQFEDRVLLQFSQNNLDLFQRALNILLQAHKEGAIEDFSISSPTLEQVYFELAKTQLHGTNPFT